MNARFDPSELAEETLARVAESVLGCAVTPPVRIASSENLGGQAHEGTLGVHRLAAIADTTTGSRPFSVVLKRAASRGDARLATQIDREARVYVHPPLGRLSRAFRPARCHAAIGHGDDAGTVTRTELYLEDLAPQPGPWTTADYAAAARAVASFHRGARELSTDEPFWSRGSAYRTFTDVPVIVAVLDSLRTTSRGLFHSEGVRRVYQFWERREFLFKVLARGPRTLAHGDVHDGNLFFETAGTGERTCVAIDWAYAGPGGLGEDAGTLAGSRFCFRDQSTEEFLTLIDVVWEAYASELVEHRDHARLGFLVYAAFDAGLRLLVDAARSTSDDDPRLADTRERLDALVPLIDECRSLLHVLHGAGGL